MKKQIKQTLYLKESAKFVIIHFNMLHMRNYISAFCLILLWFNIVLAQDTVYVRGQFLYENAMSTELKSLLFIQEQGNFETQSVYTYKLDEVSAKKLGVRYIEVVPLGGTISHDYTFSGADFMIKEEPFVELTIIPIMETGVYSSREPLLKENYGWHRYRFSVDTTYVKFRDYFWQYPDKPKYIPLYLINQPIQFRYISRLIDLLDTDIQIRPAAETREEMEKRIPLKEIVSKHLEPIRKLKLEAPESNNKADWQRWYDKVLKIQVEFEKPEIEPTILFTPINRGSDCYFYQDSLTNRIYQAERYEDSINYYFLDENETISFMKTALSKSVLPLKAEISSSDLHEKLKDYFTKESLPQIFIYKIALSENLWLVPVITKTRFQEKLNLCVVNSITKNIEKTVCVYSFVPRDEHYRKIAIQQIFRLSDRICVIFKTGMEEFNWMLIDQKDLLP